MDYGTVCHAIALSAVATAWAANKTAQGGITGFQAGAVMWEFIKNWSYSSNKTGMRLVDYYIHNTVMNTRRQLMLLSGKIFSGRLVAVSMRPIKNMLSI